MQFDAPPSRSEAHGEAAPRAYRAARAARPFISLYAEVAVLPTEPRQRRGLYPSEPSA